ncbi:MAG: 30S ribosome-binding factor RbfA [Bacteroidetes bacterium]|nr:30S ribosome-binding factor RbfA [Bacteroidota bacterium]
MSAHQESKRQKQVGRVIQEHMVDIFQKEAKEITGKAMVTISQVKMTPDLLNAYVYVSIYNTENPDEIMFYIESNTKQIRTLLGNRARHQVRRIPYLSFFKDETLDEVFRLEKIFKDLNEAKKDQPDSDQSE